MFQLNFILRDSINSTISWSWTRSHTEPMQYRGNSTC